MERMLQELMEEDKGKKSMIEEVPSTEDPALLALDNYCHITMSLFRLLKLVPRFTETVTTIHRKEQLLEALIHFVNPTMGPTVLDDQNPVVKLIIRGMEVPEVIIDGGSGVNVINKTTCDQLGITD